MEIVYLCEKVEECQDTFYEPRTEMLGMYLKKEVAIKAIKNNFDKYASSEYGRRHKLEKRYNKIGPKFRSSASFLMEFCVTESYAFESEEEREEIKKDNKSNLYNVVFSIIIYRMNNNKDCYVIKE